ACMASNTGSTNSVIAIGSFTGSTSKKPTKPEALTVIKFMISRAMSGARKTRPSKKKMLILNHTHRTAKISSSEETNGRRRGCRYTIEGNNQVDSKRKIASVLK